MTDTIESLREEIRDLERVEHMIETNSGTFGAQEACRKVGTGDPMFATRNVYETVAGVRRETGPDADDAPGYMRSINRAALSDGRKLLADLRRQLRAAS